MTDYPYECPMKIVKLSQFMMGVLYVNLWQKVISCRTLMFYDIL